MSLTPRLRLFATLALILVPLSLLHIAWRLIVNAGSVTVTDGVLRLGHGGWPEALVTFGVWIYAITVGVFVLSGGLGSPLRQALRVFPTAFAASLGAIGAAIAAALLLGTLLPVHPMTFFMAGIVLLIPLGWLLVRLALVLPIAAAEAAAGAVQSAWAQAKGRPGAPGSCSRWAWLLQPFRRLDFRRARHRGLEFRRWTAFLVR